MADHVISAEFGTPHPHPRRKRATRSAGARTTTRLRTSAKGEALKTAWDTRYVDTVKTADGAEIAGIHFGKLQKYYEEHGVPSDLPNRLAALAVYESAALIERGLFYQSQSEVESGVAEMRPGAEGLVIDGLRRATQVRWLVSRLLAPRTVDYERLLALPEQLTLPNPQDR
ncbi:hypothetical protein EYC59_05440 [Candidatus Saccharibacteria bacterium]|nr:MAG: hypothetical protein EYC59_05440 [Candidatus Saccharibacteria bacterium]